MEDLEVMRVLRDVGGLVPTVFGPATNTLAKGLQQPPAQPQPAPSPDITGSIGAPKPVETRPIGQPTPQPAPPRDLTKPQLDPQDFTYGAYVKQRQAEIAAQRRDQMFNDLGTAAYRIGGLMTKSPSARAQLLGATPVSSGDASGLGISAHDFLEFAGHADKMRGEYQSDLALPGLAKLTGRTVDELRAMRVNSPTEFAKTIGSYTKAELDAANRAERETATHEKTAETGRLGEIRQREQLEKVTLPSEAREQKTFDAAEKVRLASDESLDELSSITGKSVEVLRGLGQKAREQLVENLTHPEALTAEQKTLAQENKERAPGTPVMTLEQFRKREAEKTAELERIRAGYGPIASDAVKTAREASDAAKKLDAGFASREAARSPLLRGEGIIAGSALSDIQLSVRKAIAAARGVKDEKVENTEVYQATMAQEVLNIMSSGALGAGTGLSDKDKQFAQDAAAGRISVSPESMRRVMAIHDNAARRIQQQHAATIADTRAALPKDAGLTVKDVNVRAPGQEELRYLDNADLTRAITDPAARDHYARNFGSDTLQHALDNADKVIQSKMQLPGKGNVYTKADTEAFNTIKNTPVEDLIKDREFWTSTFKQSYGTQGENLIDLIIATKQAKKF